MSGKSEQELRDEEHAVIRLTPEEVDTYLDELDAVKTSSAEAWSAVKKTVREAREKALTESFTVDVVCQKSGEVIEEGDLYVVRFGHFYKPGAIPDDVDGVEMEYPEWREPIEEVSG